MARALSQVRDFHIGLLRESVTPEEAFSLPSVPWEGPVVTVDAVRDSDGMVVKMQLRGELFFQMVVDAFRRDAEFRRASIDTLRNLAWWMRNDRLAGEDLALRAAVQFVEWLQVMDAAGVPGPDLLALVQCLAHGCVCDGCDLARGERFVEGDWWKARGRGGE